MNHDSRYRIQDDPRDKMARVRAGLKSGYTLMELFIPPGKVDEAVEYLKLQPLVSIIRVYIRDQRRSSSEADQAKRVGLVSPDRFPKARDRRKVRC